MAEREKGLFGFFKGAPQELRHNVNDVEAENVRQSVFTFENREAGPRGKSVAVALDGPGAYAAVMPLVKRLMSDVRCRSITVITYGVATSSFEEQRGTQWAKKNEIGAQPDIFLGTVMNYDHPELTDLRGREKTFFIFEAWGNPGKVPPDGKTVDGVFVADELGQTLFTRAMPEVSAERVHMTGTPALDELYVEDSAEFTERAREKLGIAADEIVISYIGDTADDYGPDSKLGADKDVNSETLRRVLRALKKAAEENQGKKFALIVRPHPRDAEETSLLKEALAFPLPPNARVIATVNAPTADEQKDGVVSATMSEVRYASHAVMSILSTENFFAHRLGRFSAFLALEDEHREGKKLGRVAVDSNFGPDIPHEIENASDGHIFFPTTEEEVARFITLIDPGKVPHRVERPNKQSATDQMIGIMFRD